MALVFSRLDYDSVTLAGLPKQLSDRLQSVQNATARLIFIARRQDYVQPLLRSLHWLRFPERISYRLAVLHGVHRCLHARLCTRLYILKSDLQRISDRSSLLHAPPHATIGDRAFSTAAASVWNCLPATSVIAFAASFPQ